MVLRSALLLACLAPLARAQDAPLKFQTVEVRPGETLWAIAGRYLKDPAQWSEIARHNPQLGSDPTVVLPGMSLRVPVALLKPAARAAVLAYVEERVEHRAAEGEEWRPAKAGMSLYPGHWLKTGSLSRARIKFPFGEVLNLDSHSLVVIDPPDDEGQADLTLLQGRLKALNLKMRAKETAVVPRGKDAMFELSVEEGQVKVDVFAGAAELRAQGAAVELAGGQTAAVPDGRAPLPPEKLLIVDPASRLAAEKRRAARTEGTATTDLGDMEVDVRSLPVGAAVAGFRLQAARTDDFAEILLDRVFEPEERVTLRDVGLPSGPYWWRVAPVDLLGASGKFSKPKRSVLR